MGVLKRVARLPRRAVCIATAFLQRRGSLAAFRSQPLPTLNRTHAVIVAMPGGIHMADVAMSKLTAALPMLCVLNGVSAAEAQWLVNRRPSAHFMSSPRVLAHHDVINSLIDKSNHDFWLVDHDCLVLQPNALSVAEDACGDAIGAVFFATATPPTAFIKPHTFLMFIRPSVARTVFREFCVDATPRTWSQLPRRARAACESLGLSPTQLPEEGKAFFDTLCVASACAAATGRGFRIVQAYTAMFSPHPEAVHFGHTSKPLFKPEWLYGALGAYFWRASLEHHASPELQQLYNDQLASLPTLDAMRSLLIAQNTPYADAAVLDYIERLCSETS